MTEPQAIEERDLHAYIDGELDAARIPEIEAWLAGHPDDAAKVHAYKLQSIQLHNLYDGVLDEPVPGNVEAALSARPLSFSPSPWMKMAAVLVLIVFSGLAGWGLHGVQPEQQVAESGFVKQALDAHVVFVTGDGGVKETALGSGGNPMAVYSRHLGHPLRVPELAGAGFKMTGGRVLTEKGLPAAQFMYKDPSNRMVTLYVRSGFSKEDMAFRFVAENDMIAFYWTDGLLGYALTGSMKRGDLLDLARMVYEKLRS